MEELPDPAAAAARPTAPLGFYPEMWSVDVRVRDLAGTANESARVRCLLLPEDLAALRELIAHPRTGGGAARVLRLWGEGPAQPARVQQWLLRADQLFLSQAVRDSGRFPRPEHPVAGVTEVTGDELAALTGPDMVTAQHGLSDAGIEQARQQWEAQRAEGIRVLTGPRRLANAASMTPWLPDATHPSTPLEVDVRVVWAEHPTEPTSPDPDDPAAGRWLPGSAVAWRDELVLVDVPDLATPTRTHRVIVHKDDVRRRPTAVDPEEPPAAGEPADEPQEPARTS